MKFLRCLKSRHLIAIPSICLLLLNCQKSTDNPVDGGDASQGDVIFPLAVGNVWAMRRDSYDENGNLLSTVRDTFTIISARDISGETWYAVGNSPGYVNLGNYYSNRSDGCWHWQILPGTTPDTSKRSLWIKYPVTVGDRFNNLEVVSINDTVTVTAGSFDCVLYRDDSYSQSTYLYFSPEIGPIRYVDYYSNGNVRGNWEMESSSLN